MEIISRDEVNIIRKTNSYWVGTTDRDDELFNEGELCGHFDGVTTFLDYVAKHQSIPHKDKCSAETGFRGDFFSFGSFEEALDTYRNHPSRVKKFTEVDLALTDLEAPGQEGHYDVAGDYLDIGRYLEGDPEAFGVMYDGNPRARRVNMILNLTWVHYTSAEVLNARSRRIQRLVDWLEARGVRTSVTGITSVRCAHIEVLVKDHGDTLDLNDLAVVSHGDYFRRIGFRFMEYSDTWSYGYGEAFPLNRYLSNASHDNEYSAEFDICIGNNVNDVDQVNREFDQAEQKLNLTLGKLVLEPSQRFILLFKGRP